MTLINNQLDGSSFFWQGNRIGVLLAHGFTATTCEIRLLAKILHDKGYTVAGPLLAGHGTTIEDMNRTHWSQWMRAMEESYQQLKAKCDMVFVGGESMGGNLALYLASEHPEIKALLIYAPAVLTPVRPIDVLRLRLVSPFVASLPKRGGVRLDNWQGYDVNPLRGLLQFLKLQQETVKRLPGVTRPMLLVQGKLDTTIDSHGAYLVYRQVSSKIKEMHWMERSTHCVLLDKELPQIGEMTLRFIERMIETR